MSEIISLEDQDITCMCAGSLHSKLGVAELFTLICPRHLKFDHDRQSRRSELAQPNQ